MPDRTEHAAQTKLVVIHLHMGMRYLECFAVFGSCPAYLQWREFTISRHEGGARYTRDVMLYEIPATRQPEIPSSRQGFRRLFADEDFTVHVWYDRQGGRVTEFHIFYGKTRDHRLSWHGDGSLRDGTATEHGFWGRDGLVLPSSFDLQWFREAARGMPDEVAGLVLEHLERGSESG